jgi:hypothetical protein
MQRNTCNMAKFPPNKASHSALSPLAGLPRCPARMESVCHPISGTLAYGTSFPLDARRPRCSLVCKHSTDSALPPDSMTGLGRHSRNGVAGGHPYPQGERSHNKPNHGHHDGHGHDSGVHVDYHKDANWGPLRSVLFMVLERSRALHITDFLSHSLRSALVSAACFLVSAVLTSRLPVSIGMPGLASKQAATATGLLAVSLALSGLPAIVDALLQVSYFSLRCLHTAWRAGGPGGI